MRLIDADALLTILEREREYHEKNGLQIRADGIMDAIMDVIAAPTIEPERKTEWIPCSERLPEMGQPVIDDFISLNWLSYASDGIEWVFPRNVTAWMPLPEPYKGEQPCN